MAERESAAVGASGAGLLSQSLGDAKVWCSISGESTIASPLFPCSLSSITSCRKDASISVLIYIIKFRSNSPPSSLSASPPFPSLAGELIESDEASSGAVRYHLLDLQGVDRSQHSHSLVQQLLSLAVSAQLLTRYGQSLAVLPLATL